MSNSGWRTFDLSEEDPSGLEAFLEANAPSKVMKKSDGVAWISVRRPTPDNQNEQADNQNEQADNKSEKSDNPNEQSQTDKKSEKSDNKSEKSDKPSGQSSDVDTGASTSQNKEDSRPSKVLDPLDDDYVSLQEDWKVTQASREFINFDTVVRLAKEHKYLSGKWLFYADTGVSVDEAWAKVARGIVGGQLGNSAKVSPYNDGHGQKNHVICVYSEDFTNQESVYELEKGLRDVGIQHRLMYKPDAFTEMGIYSKNKWNIKPVVYTSNYDHKLQKSVIVQHNECAAAGGKIQKPIQQFFSATSQKRKTEGFIPFDKDSPVKKERKMQASLDKFM